MAKTKPLRQQIVEAVLARLRTISTGNNYRTNIGANVSEWTPLKKIFEASRTPAAVLIDELDEVTRQTTPYDSRDLHCKLAIVVAGTDSAETVRSALYDCIEALGVDERFGELNIQVILGTDELEIDQEERVIMGATLNFVIQYRTSNNAAT